MVADLTCSVVLIDKPAGPTSFVVARRAARTLGFKRAGHTGTLDSNVTGVLVIAIEEATKGISQLVGLDKGYEGQMKFSRPIADDELRAACARFVGRIAQMPPEKCAVKRRLRLRTVHSFEVTGVRSDGAGGTQAGFSVEVEAGTYVRTLVADLGEKLGCQAELVGLRRTHVGPFRLDECVALDRLRPEHAIDIVEALERVGLKKAVLTPEQIRAAQRGMPVAVEGKGVTGTRPDGACHTFSLRSYSGPTMSSSNGSATILVDSAGRIIALARQSGAPCCVRPFRVFKRQEVAPIRQAQGREVNTPPASAADGVCPQDRASL